MALEQGYSIVHIVLSKPGIVNKILIFYAEF